MESATQKWNHSVFSLLYLFFIYAILYLLHSNVLLPHESHLLLRIKKNPPHPLRFRPDGTFKILQVADLHYGNGPTSRCRDIPISGFRHCSDLNSTWFLRRMIQAENPDFIAFTGDNIFGSSATDAAESLFGAFRPAMESGIPWAAILGNHDQESTMNREELMSFISLLDYSVSQINPSVEELSNAAKTGKRETIDGFGNYNLRVFGAPGSHLANSSVLNLFFLDSGDRETVKGIRTYGWIKESQLRWLYYASKRSQGPKKCTNRSLSPLTLPTPPALAFFHIPIPEVRQLYYKTFIGQFQEAVACSSVNSGVLQTLVSMGDVKGVFMGHDHKNDFCGNLDGIWFCYGGGFGYHGYGKYGWPRRARVILAELGKGENAWMGVEQIKTWKRLDDDNFSKIDEQILWSSDHGRE
ncbi:probable inactive purple acid phosphatase 28 [Cannabis sativa]|uniref:Calcineurin-like phosphoesterase domain-containing protein n=1 Tax=Cannabis sativa TaxID=3483 RepID=A0A803Q7U2_CANSA|nr:probable inactive purple acid phosphatase 28 [Cannabis sativa]